jgi:ABC-type polysaccharide/polyol phosphate export permease
MLRLKKSMRLIGILAWQDVLQRYRRSVIGQFWITISMGILVACLGFLFGALFKTPYEDFLPFLATGLILWSFITTTISDAGSAFTSSSNMIRQVSLPSLIYILRVVWRNLIVLAHNLVILPILAVFLSIPLGFELLLFIPGLLLLSLNLVWISYMVGVFSTRFRDLPQIIQSILQIFFYITPILWMPVLLQGRAEVYLIDLNPFFHFIELARAPILGQSPSLENWFVGIATLILGSLLTALLAKKYGHRIAYWL